MSVGEFGFALAHDIGEAAQRLDPVGERVRGPFRPGGARGGDFGGGIADSPDQISAPVAGSVETSVFAMTLARSTNVGCVRQAGAGRVRGHGVAHPADGGDLGLERRPVVALGDRRPDRLDLVDLHRAGFGIGPIRMGDGRLASGQCARASAPNGSRRVALARRDRARRASRRRSGRWSPARDRRAPISAAASARSWSLPRGDAEPRDQRLDQRRLEPLAPVAEQSDSGGASPTSARQPASWARSQWIASGWRPKA